MFPPINVTNLYLQGNISFNKFLWIISASDRTIFFGGQFGHPHQRRRVTAAKDIGNGQQLGRSSEFETPKSRCFWVVETV